MVEPTVLNRKLFALLIGVDCYLPNRLPDGSSYPNLSGCVRDIAHVEKFLTERLGLPAGQIVKLTATNNGNETPPEPKAQWPTYENMVAAFKDVTGRAQPGDQIYIHYSGHGGRTKTNFKELKGHRALDESLVPTDIGRKGARYLRDVEIAHLLKQMTDKNLVVTVVFDSCHSGGATRGFGGGAVRGISSIDTTARPTDSLVAAPEELARTWRSVTPEQARNARLGSGWMPEMKGILLLAACRANELANEFAFDGRERNGALTYWLLDSLKQTGPGLTFKMLHDRILAKVHAKFSQQTPQLHGDGARVVFDTNRVARPPSVRVLQVDLTNRRIKVDAGEAQGIRAGARFAVYPAHAIDFTEISSRLALAEIKDKADVKATESWASVTEATGGATLEEGAQAVLLDAGEIRFRSRVRLIRQDNLPPGVNQEAALEQLKGQIEQSGWVRPAEDEEAVDYQIAVNADGEYEVWDPIGKLISNLRPALKVADRSAPAQLMSRLVHLTKYRNIKLIDNASSTSTLARQLTVDLTGADLDAPGGAPVLDVGESATLHIKNNSPEVLNITIFDLQPDWGIRQVYPSDADSQILDPNDSLDLPVTDVSLPEGYTEGVDTIKVFATLEGTSFRWLEMPALDQPQAERRQTRAVADPLEQLMAAFTADAPPPNKRSFNLAAAPATTWAVAQLEFGVRRPPNALKHVRDPNTSLLQAAFDEVAAEKAQQTRAKGGAGATARASRPSVSDAELRMVTDYLLNPVEISVPDEAERGPLDTAKHCASMAYGMAKEWWDAFVRGDREDYDSYKDALTAKFGGCDPNYKDALVKYAKFLLNKGKVPYRRWQRLSDFVIDGKLPSDATIGIVSDWGTGQPDAIEVLAQVKRHNPQVAIHLGDVYYAGTDYEMDHYFYQPWQEILNPEASGILSFALPGNHDLYAGGQPFYDLLDKLGQPASYFCLRNEHWQLIGLDTALHDRHGGPPTSLEPSEVEWLRDKIERAGNRRTVLMSHHQLFSANDSFDDHSFNKNLCDQLAGLLPRVDLWLWGHEHDLVVFDEYKGLKRGRCIGGSAFPVSKYEQPEVQKNPDVPLNKQIMLSKGPSFYQHCYVIIKLDGAQATVNYYEDSAGGRLLFSEMI